MSKALQDKSSSRKLQQGSRRLITKLLELFGNFICVHTNQVTILHKQPSDSSKVMFWFSEEAFQFSSGAFWFVMKLPQKTHIQNIISKDDEQILYIMML